MQGKSLLKNENYEKSIFKFEMNMMFVAERHIAKEEQTSNKGNSYDVISFSVILFILWRTVQYFVSSCRLIQQIIEN